MKEYQEVCNIYPRIVFNYLWIGCGTLERNLLPKKRTLTPDICGSRQAWLDLAG
jgi:hypothetical protein